MSTPEKTTTNSVATTDIPQQQCQDAETTQATQMTIDQIQKLLPHRYPFALVDRIIEYVPGEKAVGIKGVTFNEPHFQGHFPGRPIMPGVLIIEALAQVSGIILTQLPGFNGGLFVFAGIEKARFRRPVIPGDQLILTAELISSRGGKFGKTRTWAEVDGQKAAEGELSFFMMD